MKDWLNSCWKSFQAWCAANRTAHDKAPTLPCCSAPPPGAGQKGKRP